MICNVIICINIIIVTVLYGDMYMKKIILTACMLLCSGVAFADGNAFTPLNFDEAPSISSSQAPKATPVQSAVKATGVPQAEEALGNGNIQNAILQLDNAQVDIRNDLLNLKTKYADVDAQYKLVKNERSALKKQINAVQKRINAIDKAKEKIRKNMI